MSDLIRNYFAAAWRAFTRDRWFAVVNVGGLTVGLAAAMISGLFVRNEFSYEHFLPDYSSVYRISSGFATPGSAITPGDSTPPDVAPWLLSHMPNIAPIARLSMGSHAGIRVGGVETLDMIYWTDPAFFDVLQFPSVAGDPVQALRRPDAVVMTESVARRYFGTAQAVGRTLELDRKYLLRVAAVIRDLPATTHFAFGIVGSAKAEFSGTAKQDAQPISIQKPWNAYTYFKLQPGVQLGTVHRMLDSFLAEMRARQGQPMRLRLFLPVIRIDQIHLAPPGVAPLKPGGSLSTILAIATVGLLILAVSVINFVNLSTARASRRSIEVSVRKALGATRGQLVGQFMGEAVAYGLGAVILASCLAEWVLPAFNHYSATDLVLSYWREPVLIVAIFVLAVLVGVTAGVYPALVLGSIRAASGLKGGPVRVGGVLRRWLVIAQFAVLIGLLCAIGVVFQQASLARKMVLGLDTRGVYVSDTVCSEAAADELRAVAGVVAASCSESAPVGFIKRRSYGAVRPGVSSAYRTEVIGPGFFDMYGLKPVAGRFLSAARETADAVSVVINMTAVIRFGFASPLDAVGQFVNLNDTGAQPLQVIGVVQDYPMESVREPVEATVFRADPASYAMIHVKLSEGAPDSTLASVRSILSRRQPLRPVTLVSIEQPLSAVYSGFVSEGWMFGACSAVAALLACLGLLSLAAALVESRAREVGIRKAMGAGAFDILRQLMSELTWPVLWAQLLAWPVCYFVLSHWLNGFAYHVSLSPMYFLAAGAVAILIAWATTVTHALRLSRTSPVAALRSE